LLRDKKFIFGQIAVIRIVTHSIAGHTAETQLPQTRPKQNPIKSTKVKGFFVVKAAYFQRAVWTVGGEAWMSPNRR